MVWYERLQLFFKSVHVPSVCPAGAKDDNSTHKEVSQVYFNTFELIELSQNSVMQRARMSMLYDSARNPLLPCLYVCSVANLLGQAPLIACFIGYNYHPKIPNRFKDDLHLGSASADTQQDRDNSSRLYEVRIGMWRYDRAISRGIQK